MMVDPHEDIFTVMNVKTNNKSSKDYDQKSKSDLDGALIERFIAENRTGIELARIANGCCRRQCKWNRSMRLLH